MKQALTQETISSIIDNDTIFLKNGRMIAKAEALLLPTLLTEESIFTHITTPNFNYTLTNEYELIPFDAIVEDVHKLYSDYTYKAPQDGTYTIDLSPMLDSSATYGLFINGILKEESNKTFNFIRLKIGDLLQIKFKSSKAITEHTYTLKISLYDTIYKLNELNEISPVYCSYTYREGFSWAAISHTANSAPTLFQVKNEDDHNLYNPKTGILTIKKDGLYVISLTGQGYNPSSTGASISFGEYPYLISTLVINTAMQLNAIPGNLSMSGIARLEQNKSYQFNLQPNKGTSGNIYSTTTFSIYKVTNPKEYKIFTDKLGGKKGQVLTKNSDVDTDLAWSDLPLGTIDTVGMYQEATSEEVLNQKSLGQNHKILSIESLKDIRSIGNQGSSNHKCIYSHAYTGTLGPDDITDTQLPLNVANNSRYVLSNPFGINKDVSVMAQVYYNGKWGFSGLGNNSGTGAVALGVIADFVETEGIVIQTGITGVLERSDTTLGVLKVPTISSSIKLVPCRVHIWKTGNSDIPVFSGPIPDTHISDYLYSTEYESVMKYDNNLGLYRCNRTIEIGESIHTADNLQKGMYALDGSGFIIDSKQGKVLNSLDEDTKLRVGITILDNMIYIPNVTKDNVTVFIDLGI